MTATGDASSFHWELGEGDTADGPSVTHTYGRLGAFVPVVTATGADGSTSRLELHLTAHRLTLGAPTGGAVFLVRKRRGDLVVHVYA
jgi:hypothetical protein